MIELSIGAPDSFQMIFIRRLASTANVGFIGLGKMGAPMSNRLIEKYNNLIVFDKDPSSRNRFAGKTKVASDIAELKDCEIVFTMLPDAKSTSDVIFSDEGLVKYLKRGSTIVNSGTIGISESLDIKYALGGDYDFIDAPVSGGTIGAERGTLTFMVSGNQSSLGKVEDFLNAMGKNIMFLGDVGKGQAAKICNNMLLAIIMCGTSEAFALAKRLGLDLGIFSNIVNVSSGRSWVTECNHPVPGIDKSSPSSKNYSGGFSSNLILKDVRLALNASKQQNMNLVSLSAVESEYSKMIEQVQGSECKDMSFLFQYILNDAINKP